MVESLISSRGKMANLEGMVQRVDAHATWGNLPLPRSVVTTLKQIASFIKSRRIKLSPRCVSDNGVMLLFAGQDSSGKSLAAVVLANELRLVLYRIDLSRVISKYIGETEKNLRRVFDAAESCGAILLFDEADDLFGKRSDVTDTSGRYNNLEVGYLLQRIEQYKGIAIITANSRENIDNAYVRRFKWVIDFPRPAH